jgi:hypothetical protein
VAQWQSQHTSQQPQPTATHGHTASHTATTSHTASHTATQPLPLPHCHPATAIAKEKRNKYLVTRPILLRFISFKAHFKAHPNPLPPSHCQPHYHAATAGATPTIEPRVHVKRPVFRQQRIERRAPGPARQPQREGPRPGVAGVRLRGEEPVGVAWGVAVVGWEWYRWIEEIEAVRMVPVGMWQWQYWQRYEMKHRWQCGE